MAEETQTYMAKSVFTDLTAVASFIILLLQIPYIETILNVLSFKIDPGGTVNLVKAGETLAAVIGLWHRTFYANNPVTFIAPRQVKPVEVKSLTPTLKPDLPKDGE